MTSRSDYLLEIGTEELPASFLESAAWELKERARDALEKNLLDYGEIRILQTPRRLTLIVHDLATTQKASDEVIKGPPTSIALDEHGNPTKAASGFAKKMGVNESALKRETIDGTEYLVYHKHSSGRPAEAVLPDIVPEVVLGLSGSHFMTWDESGIKFSRPIRWIVSLLGDKPVPIEIGLLHSGQLSRGHRFFSESEEITIPNTQSYTTVLKEVGHVIADQTERRQMILNGLQQKGQELHGTVPENESLLDTVTMLVESPALISGSFSEQFLVLPKEVITTVMAAHQKYFPVENAANQLLPYFITISNNTDPSAAQLIRQGNEKVLRARLEDASFFFQEDSKHPLQYYVDALKGITFQKGLGTLYDKTERLKKLVASIGKLMTLSALDINDAIRAAELSKADLATNMVRELTELQGIIGKHYAERSGEKSTVASAISEHYQPRFMGDAVAYSNLGIALSLADKLDTMLAVFSQKNARYPTGSKDPMGLRRMALGVLQTIIENKITLNLDEALQFAYRHLESLAQEPEADSLDRTRQFLLQRFKGYLLDQNYSYDTIDAILEADVSPFADLNSVMQRLHLLKTLQQQPEALKQIYEPANRTARILGKAYQPTVAITDINSQYFEDESEQALYEAITRETLAAVDSKDFLQAFQAWSPIVERFFDNVLVNVEHAEIRENRYNLLSLLNQRYRQFADFTKLVV